MTAARVLVIDDEDDVRMIVRFALESDGRFEVTEARNGAEGLHAAQRSRPDVVLLDAMMPGLDGYAVCRRMRTEPSLADVPIIFLTAKTQGYERREGLAAGATDYLTKPFDPIGLADRLATILAAASAAGGGAAGGLDS
jgi:CheY-like chemotaxis protein